MKVTLLTQTENMIDAVWLIWQLSRSQDSSSEILDRQPCDTTRKKFFEQIINEDIPLAEMIDFIFVLDEIPISLREQLVRHRIGVKVAGQAFCDIVPDLADSSFWSQSMRVLDMGQFCVRKKYFIPESLKGHQVETYEIAMENAEDAYQHLVAAGVPREDARNVIPLGATHRLIWKLNLAAIKHIMSKRGCWILQLGLWKPVIQGMVAELCKFSPAFRELASPPCMKGDDFKVCMFCENNYARIEGDVDPLPPCPLFLNYYEGAAMTCAQKVFPTSTTCWYHQKRQNIWTCSKADRIPLMQTMRAEYTAFWNRDVDTGKRL